jgi:mono/diheme cytochrome c family protein
VQGRARGRGVRLSGVGPQGARLVWKGHATAGGLRGHLKVRLASQRLVATLVLSRRVQPPLGGSCDDPFFVDEVLAHVLVPVCATCHVAGGQAGATSLVVDAHDVAGTQARVAQQVDAADPARSRLLLKPLGLVPHGGGTQLAAESPEAAILRQWADTVASGACGTPPPPPDPYTAQCASCHGPDARGTELAPSVRCSAHVRSVVRKGRGRGANGMPAFAASVLPDADLDAIVATLAAACDASGDARPADLFLGNCAGCHGDTGGGGRDARDVPGPSIRCADVGEFLERVPVGGDGMPAFPELSRDDVRAMHDYVHGFCR